MKTIFLHGYMKDKYGAAFELDVETSAEAVRALAVQLPGFEDDVRAGSWHVLRGPLEAQESLDESGVNMTLGRDREIHLIPAVEGANNGVFMTIVGVVLFVAGFFTGGSTWGPAMMAMGVGFAVGGIVAMTTKMPSTNAATDSQESAENRTSFLFNGATNTSSQGGAVPRGYGRVRVGSIVVSAAIYAEEMA